jgi:DNA repair photolyase
MPDTKSNMYADAQTWNPFKGCRFHCVYCGPSFQRQSKRQKHLCDKCYKYVPHCHEERLKGIPSASIIFVSGNADISFCPPRFTRRIIEAVAKHKPRNAQKTFYFQSKRPEYFDQFLSLFPANVILLTTLETNIDKGYKAVSKAPPPTRRYRQFKKLKYPRKVVTIEPVMDFDEAVFPQWIVDLEPEYVWLGLNSKPEALELPEPSPQKLRKLVKVLVRAGIEIRGKELRGLDLGIPQ